jgi:iron only hydrogenase large subunit-like protein
MKKFSSEFKAFLKLLDQRKKMVAMLAPSFPVDFTSPEIVGKLKRLGFAFVVEVARGAMETNRQLLKLLEKNPRGRYLTSPCPAIVRLIRNKYPQLKPFLAPIGSPMANTAKLVLKKYPQARPVFIGPCPVKRFEAREDYPDLNILVLTYKEIKKIFEIKKVKDNPRDTLASFDLAGPPTRLYPISGGLAQSAGLNDLLTDEEYDVVSGFELAEQSLGDFEKNKRIRILDILYCEGGCIAGQGIASSLPAKERREKVISHWA